VIIYGKKRDPKPKFLQMLLVQNEDCEDYGKINNGNIISNMVHTRQKKWVKYINFTAKTCEKSFTSNSNTISL
jgi:hypothetical protein